jgi:fructokinase
MLQSSFKIVGIGELLWDMLPCGKQLGGAPANFVYYCNLLNMQAWLVSTIGNDELGSQSLKWWGGNK